MKKEYPSFMDGFSGFKNKKRHPNGQKQMDWKKVKEYIEKNKDKIDNVIAGLAEDWGCTSGEIYNREDGYIPQYNINTYTASSWATPAIDVEFLDGTTELIEMSEDGDNPYLYLDL